MRIMSAVAAVLVLALELSAQAVDPNYKALREAVPAESFLIENQVIERDVAQFTLRIGTITFLTPVQERRMMAVFRGEGTFQLLPVTPVDRDALVKIAGSEKPTAPFSAC